MLFKGMDLQFKIDLKPSKITRVKPKQDAFTFIITQWKFISAFIISQWKFVERLWLDYSVVVCRDLSRPSQSKIEQKLPKMAYIVPNFFVLQIGENFPKNPNKHSSYRCVKICIKMWMKTCFHSQFYANFHEFLWWVIKATHMLQLYTAYFLWF